MNHAVHPSRRTFLVGLIGASLVAGRTPGTAAQDAPPLTVAAAADLTPAFEEIGALFTVQTGVEIAFTFGSTGQLAQQIEAGAPVDVFAAANIDYIDQLEGQALIVPGTKARYALGRIVLWTLPDSTRPIDAVADLTNPAITHIAIANPNHAPYGVAAREALQHAGIWDVVQPRLVLGENVRDTLRYAETGDVDVAIVALSLAIQGDGRWTLIPAEEHAPSTRRWRSSPARSTRPRPVLSPVSSTASRAARSCAATDLSCQESLRSWSHQ